MKHKLLVNLIQIGVAVVIFLVVMFATVISVYAAIGFATGFFGITWLHDPIHTQLLATILIILIAASMVALDKRLGWMKSVLSKIDSRK